MFVKEFKKKYDYFVILTRFVGDIKAYVNLKMFIKLSTRYAQNGDKYENGHAFGKFTSCKTWINVWITWIIIRL